MAIGNKAKALRFFADISQEYRDSIYIEAYQALVSIIDKPDLIEVGGIAAREAFKNELSKIESRSKNKKDLLRKQRHSKYCRMKLSAFERFYLDYCVKERLFLNFHVHEDRCEAAIKDPIFISLTSRLDENDTFYQYAKYINQIKEDYAVARLLLVQSQYKRRDLDRISMRTTYVNTLDYSVFNLYIGLLQSAFKEAYNILDKIAVFINAYCNLRVKERIHFHAKSVWEDNNKAIRDEILKLENISLCALYDIYKDVKSDYYGRIREIRNASTHRNLIIFDFPPRNLKKNEDMYNISSAAMLNETTELLRLVKSAIIYLINFVNIEENKKRNDGLVAPLFVDTSQFL